MTFQIPNSIDTLQEAREFYSDLYFVYWGRRPTEFLTSDEGQSTFYLRVMGEDIMKLMAEEMMHGKIPATTAPKH